MKLRTFAIALFVSLFVAVGSASAQEIVVVDGVKYRVHDVVKGETLYSLARQYGVTVDEIIAANETLVDGLKADSRIRIPMPTEANAEPKTKAEKKAEKKAQAEELAVIEPVQTESVPVVPVQTEPTPVVETVVETTVEPVVETVQPAVVPVAPTTEPTAEKVAEVAPITENSAPNGTDSLQMNTAPTSPAHFRKLKQNDVAEVALMLPLGSTDKPAANYLDFYRGFLIGLDSVRMAGYSVNLTLHNTAHDYLRVDMLTALGTLATTDLVVGPVYEDELIPIASAFRLMGTPIVSPLADLKHISNDNVFQMSPSQASKYNKVKNLFDGSRRVVIISAESVDAEFDAEVRALIQPGTTVVEHKYVYEHPSVIEKREKASGGKAAPSPSDLTPLLRGKTPSVVVITANNEVDVDRILAALAAARTSLVSRSISTTPFEVLGNNRWNRFVNIDRANLFATNVIMLSTYHARRSEPIVKAFDSRFVKEFGSIPTRYAYRGYDAAVVFVRALFENIDTGLQTETIRPLLTPYRFEYKYGGVRVNSEWVKVMYHNNYTITND